MSPFPPLVIGVVMVSKSRGSKGDDDGLGFHGDSSGGRGGRAAKCSTTGQGNFPRQVFA